MTDQERVEQKRWSQIVARAWADETFRERLTFDPRTVLREHGLELAPEIEVKVCMDTDRVRHFVLPPNPAGQLSEEELTPTAGMDSYSGDCHRCHRCGHCGCGCDAF